jgi:lipoate-protein ligase A
MHKLPLKLFELINLPILEQLKLEEYLLRDTQDNICLINTGSPPAIVMGISGNPEELVYLHAAKKVSIPLIKRFSGGGTVVIDEQTLFVTFIFNASQIKTAPFPEAIYQFTANIYKQVFKGTPFEFKQNDYILNDKKIGGNAQYIKKDRWLHHTSFLWDYNPSLMALLKHPKKTPAYRQDRSHEEFITTLKSHLPSKLTLFDNLRAYLKEHFNVEFLAPIHAQPSRISSQLIDT